MVCHVMQTEWRLPPIDNVVCCCTLRKSEKVEYFDAPSLAHRRAGSQVITLQVCSCLTSERSGEVISLSHQQ